jgi:hypothetical protein
VKTRLDALGNVENESDAQNMKTGVDAVGTAKNECGRAKLENGTGRPRYRQKCVRDRKTWKREPWHSVLPKMSQDAQSMKTGRDVRGTIEHESRSVKLENGT